MISYYHWHGNSYVKNFFLTHYNNSSFRLFQSPQICQIKNIKCIKLFGHLENLMVPTTDYACILNIGPVFICKLFEMLQIVLLGLVLKSGSEWPHRKIYTFSDECENSCKRSNTYIIHPNEARAFIWSNAYLISASRNICWATPDGSVPL